MHIDYCGSHVENTQHGSDTRDQHCETRILRAETSHPQQGWKIADVIWAQACSEQRAARPHCKMLAAVVQVYLEGRHEVQAQHDLAPQQGPLAVSPALLWPICCPPL